MNAFRKTLLAAVLAAGVGPVVVAAAEPPAELRAREMERQQLERGGSADAEQRAAERRLEEARARLERDTAEVARLSSQMGRNFAYSFNQGPGQPRSLLGVVVDRNEQKDGAHVREVSPGGAAAEAGIKPGDIITSIGGEDLTKDADPGRLLVERMGQIEPNLKVQVGVLREGKRMNFDVTPRPSPVAMLSQGVTRLPYEVPFQVLPGRSGVTVTTNSPGMVGERRVEIRTQGEGPDDGTRFRDMEFATLSEKLGGYFGVKSGVLVVRAGGNSAFKLQDGDVILAIDGREPTSAQHAGRILRSYGDGEKLKLRVQRDRKAQDIEITMPNGPGERRPQGTAALPQPRN